MKRLFNISPYVLLLLLWVLACTKDVNLITEVEFELSENHDQEGFVNQPLATTVTVVPEVELEDYTYSFTYNVLEGVGYFENSDGKTYSSTEKIPFNPLSSSVMYKGTEKGTHFIKIVAQDNYGQKQETQITYTIIDVPVEWTATSTNSEIELGKQASVLVTLGVAAEAIGVTYERNYSIIKNQGVLNSSDGTTVEIDSYASITAGSYQITFTPEALGPATLEFRLRDSNKQKLSTTLNFEVVADVEDTNAPELQLSGANPLELFLGVPYTEPGASASDDIDGDISERITIDASEIDTTNEGTYEVQYSVSDDDGNTTSAARTVNVVRDPNGNSPPVANNDLSTTEVNKAVSILVLENDTDSDTDQSELIIIAVSPHTPANSGILEFDTREIRFEPSLDFEGEVTLEYTISDGNPGNNATATVTLTITDTTIAPTSIEVSPKTLGLEVGNTQQLTGRILPANATNQNIQWSSSDTNIATVDNNGNVTAVALGKATITTASSENNSLTDSAEITVTATAVLVNSITVTRNRSTILDTETEQFTAVVEPSNASNQTVNWSSDDTSVATVDTSTGMVTAVAEGSASIAASATDGSGTIGSASITVTAINVDIPVNGITVTRNRSSILDSEAEQFTAVISPTDATNQNVSWASDNTNVATVDSNTGLVTAVAEGVANITATATDGSGIIGTASIVVVASSSDILVNNISVSADNNSVPISGSVNFSATVLPADATNNVVSWSSDNPGFASVDPTTGVVTGFSEGTATITATATDGSGVTGSGSITVTAALSGANDITSYSYPHISGSATIDANNHTVTVQVFTGTDRTVAPRPIGISEFATINPGDIGRDFYVPQTYTVTAQNGDRQDWIVTISEDTNNTKEITKFTINGVDGDIRGTDIIVNLPPGTDLSTLTPIIEHTGASVFPDSGAQQDLRNQKQYIVKSSSDGSEVIYTVNVNN